MSTYYPRTKDLTRTRKSVTDSPPSSPSPTDKNYRHERLSRYDSSGESVTDKPLGRTSSYTRRETRLAALNRQEQDSTTKDYKKMYAEALHENEKLKSRLQDSKQELVKIRSQLEKVTQRHDRISERSTVLESEKREKQALEKRVSNMEDELKMFPPHYYDNTNSTKVKQRHTPPAKSLMLNEARLSRTPHCGSAVGTSPESRLSQGRGDGLNLLAVDGAWVQLFHIHSTAFPALAQVQTLRRVNECLLAENRAMLRPHNFYSPLFFWCLYSPLVLCCVPLRQILTELKSDNQRLKDENGALIRVISKLSK
ncbi:hypothetical protein FQN60_001733 [Etheostoma spectabile]|uniref:cGMP-dependent protein kinase interacting domain-containing protein n=1 Tax=Etheostoma spectabile TaxID=54343 RepID=A0A5J5DCG5_9PERO|nr:hypothetical protein FQN60_001733 [Etheostoma spectabile]